MNIVKCPNPACPFQFDATLVPPGAVIACPQCRLQFQLPQVAPTYPPPQTVAPPPEPEPLEVDPQPPEDAPDRNGRGRSRRRTGSPPARKGGAAALVAILVVGVALLCCGGGIGLFFLTGMFGGGKTSDTTPYTYPEYSLSFAGPGDGWELDKETQTRLKMNLACFKHASPIGHIAVRATKTEGEAAKGDLLPVVKGLLSDPAHFDDMDETFTPTEVKFLGGDGERYEFLGLYKERGRGEEEGVGCRGEVHAVAVRNMKVWVYCWAERDRFDELAPAFEKFRAGMKLEAKGGGPKVQRQREEFRGTDGRYTLTDAEGVWKKQGDPARQDAAADLWLSGYKRVPTTGQLEAKPNADLLVAVLEPSGDPVAQARAHIIAQDAEGGVVNDQVGDPVGEAPADGPVAATDDVLRFTKKYPDTTGSADKLIVFKVVDSGGKRVVAYGWCQLKQASYWEQRLMLLVGTLKALK